MKREFSRQIRKIFKY